MTERFDVVVAGGGPAGTTVAAMLARRGRSVLLLEKDRHPRFHIGESLLPMNLPILEELGVLDAVREIGVVKRGADFCVGDSMEFVTFRFSRALGQCPPSAYEVRRAEFDQILLGNAARLGADCRQQCTVQDVQRPDDGDWTVAYDTGGTTRQAVCRYFVDATGRDCLMAGRNQWRVRNRAHASAAIFAHYEGVTRRSGEDAGNISIYWFEHGWIWMIPLQGELMSVGAVCRPDYLRRRRGDPTAFLSTTLQLCPEAWARMAGACLQRPAEVTGNYSYRSRETGGDGYLLVGDAYAFVDPVFSSGVYIAMSSAQRAVPVVERWLDDRPRAYRLALARYRRDTDRAIRTFSWFIYRFTSPVMRDLFSTPRNILGAEQAVISMLAGDVYRTGLVRLKLAVFQALYGIGVLLRPSVASLHRHGRLAAARDQEPFG